MPVIEGYLDGRVDLLQYGSWIYSQMDDWRNNSTSVREDVDEGEIDDAFDEIRSLMKRLEEDYAEQGSPEDVNSILSPSSVAEPYNRYLMCIKEDKQTDYFWHMWKTDDTALEIKQTDVDELGLDSEFLGKPIGYSDKLISSTLLQNSALIQHSYHSIPESLSWQLTPVNDIGGPTVYYGAQPFCEIDAACKVPWIPPSYHSHQFASKALNGDLQRDDQWQRLVSVARIHEIRAFAKGPKNYMFNPTLLYANPNHPSVNFDHETNVLTVDFEFLGEKAGAYFDYIPFPNEEDRRPLWIVDGQHRIRGFGAAARGSMLTGPFILMMGDGEEEARALVARIFTEINTTAKSLDKMHQLYLKYEFKIPARSSSHDFQVGEDGEPIESSRPNRYAYRLALNLSADIESPLYNSIQFQDPDSSSAKRIRMKRHLIVKSTNWMDKAKAWFRAGGIYSDASSDDYHYDEVKNFFVAYQETCNHDGWEDGKPRWKGWKERRSKKPIIQQQGPFRALMDMIQFTVQTLVGIYPSEERPFSVEQFKRVLSPLKNIDWLADDELRSLKGRGNLNVPHLKMWMGEAIRHGEVFSAQQILNSELKSLSGRGLVAPPSNEEMEIELEGDGDPWPGQLPLQVRMKRPIHSIRAGWVVEVDVGGRRFPINVEKAWFTSDERKSILTIKKEALPPRTDAIIIRGRWSNGIDDALSNPIVYQSP